MPRERRYDFELPNIKSSDPNYMRQYVKQMTTIPAYCNYCKKMFNAHSIKAHNKTASHIKNKEKNEVKAGDISYVDLKNKYEELEEKYSNLKKSLTNLSM
jgi:hypothetical protein